MKADRPEKTPKAPAPKRPDQERELFEEVVARSGGLVLPRVALMYDLSDAVKEGRAEPRQYLLGDKTNLGRRFVALVGPWRPHALRIVDRDIDAESFDMGSPVFHEIEREARQGRRTEGRVAQVGIQFLLWIPRRRKFALFDFSKTATRNANTAILRTGKFVLFTSEVVGKRRRWHIPRCEDAPRRFYTPAPTKKYQAALFVFTNCKQELPR